MPAAAMSDIPDDDDDDGWSEGTDTRAGAAKETWAHVFAARKTWAVLHGNTWAPWATLQQDGLRLRMVTGYAGYRYTSIQYDPKTPDGAPVQHLGIGRTLDALVGYQGSAGAWTWKAFAGLNAQATVLKTVDRELPAEKRQRYGAKGVFETWFNVSPRGWLSLDLGATAIDRAWTSRLRAGWKPHEAWSVGPEVHLLGNRHGDTQRLGAFVRFDDGTHELSAAAGYDRTSGQTTAPYGSVQYMYRF